MSPKIIRFFPAILVLFHIIGVVLFIQADTASDLTWLNLTLCGILVFLSEPNRVMAFFLFFFIFLGGFIIELIGTKTGYLFGNYAYGETLGAKIADVSIMIGVNWYCIVLASSNLARYVKGGILGKAILAGLLSTLIDFIIEPVAIQYGFWSWNEGVIPFYNYFCWFVFASLFSYAYLKTSDAVNKTAFWLFFIWFSFFTILSFT